MREPLHNYMKMGIVHFVAYPCLDGTGPILETIYKICQDPYFEAIEISWIQDREVRKQAQEMLLTSGIRVLYVAHPWLILKGLDLNAEDEAQRSLAISAVKQAVDDAAEFEVSCVSLLSGAYPGMTGKALAMDRLEDSLQQICQYGEQKKIDIILEVFDQNIDKKCLIGKASDAAEIASKVCKHYDNFGLLVDLSHLPLLGETAEQALLPAAPYLKHVHLGNCYIQERSDPAWGDMHPRFGYPGSENDVAQIADFLRVLFDIGYLQKDQSKRPVVSFEIKPMGNENPDLVIANAKRKLNEAWAML